MKDEKGEDRGKTFPIKLTFLRVLIILIATGSVYVLTKISLLHWDENQVKDWAVSLGVFAPLATIGMMVMHSFLPVPGEIVAILNGMLFGPVWGVIYTWFGAMIGAYLSFFLTRKFGQRMISSLFPSFNIGQLSFWKNVESPWTLLMIRLIPLISFNLINYALGLSSISLWRFTWTTAIGILPGTIFSVVLGHSLVTANLWMTTALGVVLLMTIVLVRMRKRRQKNKI